MHEDTAHVVGSGVHQDAQEYEGCHDAQRGAVEKSAIIYRRSQGKERDILVNAEFVKETKHT